SRLQPVAKWLMPSSWGDDVSMLAASGERSPQSLLNAYPAPGPALERGVSPCRALAPTRRSCILHCKEQSENNESGAASVSCTRRLVKRDPANGPRLAGGARVRATKSPERPAARAGWHNLVSTLFWKILVTRRKRVTLLAYQPMASRAK